jgi:SHAQKYF class myb-like DNA-binding protein
MFMLHSASMRITEKFLCCICQGLIFNLLFTGTPWTEEEHRMFLLGLQKLGKGDWRGIARNYVISRTPTQVASHAQKYFIRQSNVSRRKRRSSLFDIVADDVCHFFPLFANTMLAIYLSFTLCCL